ncbi:MAG: hypothetical protein IJP99_10625 [Methanobrevibacter sp.]|nr:hypothetical protein [Methanobrevibacter sp.]MBR0059772.1 hypothetical protein [Methanobrevibacter sp.]
MNTIKQRVRHVDYEHKSALVLNRKGKAYSVNLSDKVIHDGIQAKDIAHIRIINGVWIVVDFERPYYSENDEYAWADAELIGDY